MHDGDACEVHCNCGYTQSRAIRGWSQLSIKGKHGGSEPRPCTCLIMCCRERLLLYQDAPDCELLCLENKKSSVKLFNSGGQYQIFLWSTSWINIQSTLPDSPARWRSSRRWLVYQVRSPHDPKHDRDIRPIGQCEQARVQYVGLGWPNIAWLNNKVEGGRKLGLSNTSGQRATSLICPFTHMPVVKCMSVSRWLPACAMPTVYEAGPWLFSWQLDAYPNKEEMIDSTMHIRG